MTVPYDQDSSAKYINDYYTQQAGGVLPVFRGSTIQQGSGIGGIFSAMRGMIPMLKKGAEVAGKQLLNTGLKIANDVIEGENFADAAKTNLKTGGKELLNNLTKSFNSPKRGVTKKRPKQSKRVKTKRRRVTKDIFM